MGDINKYGLSRRPPSSIRRAIRQNAGFGCVICGLAIGDYEHVDPLFTEATEHDPKCMTFLCIWCHGKVTRGQLSKQTVKEAMRSPAALKTGFSFEVFDVGREPPTIHIGALTAKNCEAIIRVNSRSVLSIKPPEQENGPVRISAEFRNDKGEVTLSIVDNEWRACTDNWDVEVTGQKIIIRKDLRDIALTLRAEPRGDLHVESINMSIEGYRFWTAKENLFIQLPNGNTIESEGIYVENFDSAIEAVDGSISFGSGEGLESYSYVTKMSGIGRIPRKIDINVSRNSLCKCDSGRKFKHCCGAY